MRSPAIAAAVTIPSVLFFMLAVDLSAGAIVDGHSDLIAFITIVAVVIVPALVAFITGTLHYLRRIEP
jgi:hypothetical protein